MKAILGGDQVRHYYFDPKQGVSLEDHIAAVKKVTPEAHVESFVDKDGFTVVKKVIKKHYKYSLDQMLSNTPADIEQKFKKRINQVIEQSGSKIEGKHILLFVSPE